MLSKLFPIPKGELAQAVMLGMNFAVGMAIFSFLGFYVDQKRGQGGILFSVIGICLGLAYGGYEVWKVIRILNAQAADACRPRPRERKDHPQTPAAPGASGQPPEEEDGP